MDPFIESLPFFTTEHLNLSQSVETFVGREIEPLAFEEGDVDQRTRDYVPMEQRKTAESAAGTA